MLELGFKVFLSYLAGSLNGALLIGRLFGGVDIRKFGSGNAGGTNALRTQGKLFGFLVMIVDLAKGYLPVVYLPAMAIPLIGIDQQVSREWLIYACGAAAVVGHCYPVWFEFSGGKGAATSLGVLAGISAPLLPLVVFVWCGTLFISGYVGLATIFAAAAIPVFLLATTGFAQAGLAFFTAGIAGFIVFTHRSNIRRLISGTSSRDIRFSLFGRSG